MTAWATSDHDPTWVADYANGLHVETWDAMSAAGNELRADPRQLSQAKAVAAETMSRVRSNLVSLTAALTADGYLFECADPIQPPSHEVAAQLDEIERVVALPISLRAWMEVVGSVNLTGSHPGWSVDYADPLVVECSPALLLDEYEEAQHAHPSAAGGFAMPLAPDYFHKANVSGGAPYSMWLPSAGADGSWNGDTLCPHSMFVPYLRWAILYWAGFPGWSRHPGWETTELSRVRPQLVPF